MSTVLTMFSEVRVGFFFSMLIVMISSVLIHHHHPYHHHFGMVCKTHPGVLLLPHLQDLWSNTMAFENRSPHPHPFQIHPCVSLLQLENPPQREEDHAPEFIKVRENLRRITTEERAL